MTSRRGFLGSMIAAAALDPEKLLWVPGKKVISIPRPQPKLYLIHRLVQSPNWYFSTRSLDDGDLGVGRASIETVELVISYDNLSSFIKAHPDVYFEEVDVPRLS